jgi:pimeloyl-ACP methyl ester carboxylesterase
MATRTHLTIDRTLSLDINGSSQKLRMCAARAGLPPVLIVQAGPGLPVLHEAAKFQRLLNLEKDFLVCYWDQRGCGDAFAKDAESSSMSQQVADVKAVVQWLYGETKQRIVLFGISLGGTAILRAVESEAERVRAIVAISPDSQTAISDAYIDTFIRERTPGRSKKLAPPPYLEPSGLQQRAGLLADLGCIEHGRTFRELAREMLFGLIRTYGIVGTIRTLRNMRTIQRKVLPEFASLDLLSNPPRVPVPVHYVFGENDAITPPALVKDLPASIAAPEITVVCVPEGGHMVHFDHPEIVRSIVLAARS